MTLKIVRALNRGLDVLEAIQASKAASLHDLHLATALPKPTLLRILKTLTGRDLVWQRMADGAYIASYTFSKRAGAIDEEAHFAEAAAPVLADLCRKVRWPSILAVPRLDHMAVIETNQPMSYFNYILSPPLGFRINMLRSASGRTYLSFCSPKERAAILARLRNSTRPGDAMARNAAKIRQIIADTRRRGYGTRDADFGGHYDHPAQPHRRRPQFDCGAGACRRRDRRLRQSHLGGEGGERSRHRRTLSSGTRQGGKHDRPPDVG